MAQFKVEGDWLILSVEGPPEQGPAIRRWLAEAIEKIERKHNQCVADLLVYGYCVWEIHE